MIALLLMSLSLPASYSASLDDERIGILFVTPPAAGQTTPTNPILLAKRRASEENVFELVDAKNAPVSATPDVALPPMRVIRLTAIPGVDLTSVAKDGRTKTVLWTIAGKRLLFDDLDVGVSAAALPWVLMDAEFTQVPLPKGLEPSSDGTMTATMTPSTDPTTGSGMGTVPVAGTPTTPKPPVTVLSGVKKLVNGRDAPEDTKEGVRAALENPETINRPLQALLSSNRGWAFLRDLELDLKTFQSEDDVATLGLAYSFKKSFNPDDWDIQSDGSVTGLEYAFSAEGNVAFEGDVNPQDFLSSTLSMNYFRSTGGVLAVPTDQGATATQFKDLADKLVKTKSAATSDVGKELKKLYQSSFTTMYYHEFGLNASLESDQSFSEKNYTLGAQFGFNVCAPNPKSPWSHWNIVDHPAALLRLLTGYESSFTPRGNAVPWVMLGIDHVTPDGEDPRAVAGDGSEYWRGKIEFAYRAPIARFDGIEYYLGASWRAYQEIDPSKAVRDADQDDFNRFVLTIASQKGLFASYASGRLPFDDQNSETFSLGWSVNF